MTFVFLKLILGTANMILPNHGTAGQYTSETQSASAAGIIWLQVCSRSTWTSTEGMTEL